MSGTLPEHEYMLAVVTYLSMPGEPYRLDDYERNLARYYRHNDIPAVVAAVTIMRRRKERPSGHAGEREC